MHCIHTASLYLVRIYRTQHQILIPYSVCMYSSEEVNMLQTSSPVFFIIEVHNQLYPNPPPCRYQGLGDYTYCSPWQVVIALYQLHNTKKLLHTHSSKMTKKDFKHIQSIIYPNQLQCFDQHSIRWVFIVRYECGVEYFDLSN